MEESDSHHSTIARMGMSFIESITSGTWPVITKTEKQLRKTLQCCVCFTPTAKNHGYSITALLKAVKNPITGLCCHVHFSGHLTNQESFFCPRSAWIMQLLLISRRKWSRIRLTKVEKQATSTLMILIVSDVFVSELRPCIVIWIRRKSSSTKKMTALAAKK